MLKEMSVEKQTLYKKWQEMNKGGKMAKVKNKLYDYRTNLWVPSDLDDVGHTIKQIEEFRTLCCDGNTRKRCYRMGKLP